MLSQISNFPLLLTLELGTAGSENLFKSPVKIVEKLGNTGMDCVRRISYLALLSGLRAQSRDIPRQVEPGGESMELAIAFHAPSVPS